MGFGGLCLPPCQTPGWCRSHRAAGWQSWCLGFGCLVGAGRGSSALPARQPGCQPGCPSLGVSGVLWAMRGHFGVQAGSGGFQEGGSGGGTPRDGAARWGLWHPKTSPPPAGPGGWEHSAKGPGCLVTPRTQRGHKQPPRMGLSAGLRPAQLVPRATSPCCHPARPRGRGIHPRSRGCCHLRACHRFPQLPPALTFLVTLVYPLDLDGKWGGKGCVPGESPPHAPSFN